MNSYGLERNGDVRQTMTRFASALVRLARGLDDKRRADLVQQLFASMETTEAGRDLAVALYRYGARELKTYGAALLVATSQVVLTFPRGNGQAVPVDAACVNAFLGQVAREAMLPEVSVAWRLVQDGVAENPTHFGS